MTYRATVIKIMIASPSDVPKERGLARDVLHDWNAVHSERTGIVLMPIAWETHSSPAMGASPQEIINQQLLQGCDLLVAVFWTRIGSSTGNAPSGTVEEIRKHLAAGKPAMIYFSSAPVRPDSIDEQQYTALKQFREECRAQGLVESYESLSEFREKFARQLAQTIIRNYADVELQQGAEASDTERQLSLPPLSQPAREILLATAEDSHGILLALRVRGGIVVQASGRQIGPQGDPRSDARLRAAIDQLCELSLLEPRGQKGEMFAITHRGYEVADRLRQEAEDV